MKSFVLGLFGLILVGNGPARADFVLYDGSKNTTPGQQGWIYLTNPQTGSKAVESLDSGSTVLDTTAETGDMAGYFSKVPLLGSLPQMPTLDRSQGYTVSFSVQIDSEFHTGSDRNGDGVDDRSGFSLIALSQDLKGIELGFWTDRVWAHSDASGFPQAEHAAFDTTRMANYELSVLGDSYRLFANGVELLDGTLRDYSAFGLPYNQPSFLFLGDDTSSANAKIRLAQVSVRLSPVSEPSSLLLLGVGVIGGSLVRARKEGVGR